MLTDADLDRIEQALSAFGDRENAPLMAGRVRELCAEVRRLRGVEASDAELQEFRDQVARNRRSSNYWIAGQLDKLLAHIAHLNTVIADAISEKPAAGRMFRDGVRAGLEAAAKQMRQVAEDYREYGIAATAEIAASPSIRAEIAHALECVADAAAAIDPASVVPVRPVQQQGEAKR